MKMNQRSYPAGSGPLTVTDATMMRRRSTDKDPSGTVRVLRWVSVIGLLLPVFLLAVVAWIEHSNILTRAERDGTKIVALFREQAGNLFTGHELILDIVVNRMRDRNRDKNQFANVLLELENMDKRLDDASEILLVDAGGAVLASTANVRPDQPASAPDQKCFLALSKNEATSCISQPRSDPRSGVKLFSLSRRMEQGGVFSGIVQVAISADYIVNLWASTAPNEYDTVTMFTSDGTVLAQSGARSQAGLTPPDVGRTLINKIGQSAAGIIRAPISTNGDDRITVYAMLAEHPVYVSLSLAKSEILKEWYIILAVYGVVAGCFVAGAIMALTIALRRVRAFNSLLAVNRRQ
jgi:Cache domain